MLESFNELTDCQPSTKRIEVRGWRLAQATSALMSPPMHPEARLEGESLDFRRKARVSRRAGVIDSCLLDKLVLARGQVPLFMYIAINPNHQQFTALVVHQMSLISG